MKLFVGCLATSDPKQSSAGSFEVMFFLFLQQAVLLGLLLYSHGRETETVVPA